MRLGAGRFVAGETLDACLDVLAGLNAKGLHANTTLLGEDVTSREETAAVVAAYRTVLDRIAERRLRANVALKLTHLGLLIDEALAFENVAELVDHAASLDNFIRIDMEHSAVVDATLRTHRRLRESGRDNVGCVLQSYLYRSSDDLEALLPLAPNLRLVKGAYLESAAVAYPRKHDVDQAYRRLLEADLRRVAPSRRRVKRACAEVLAVAADVPTARDDEARPGGAWSSTASGVPVEYPWTPQGTTRTSSF